LANNSTQPTDVSPTSIQRKAEKATESVATASAHETAEIGKATGAISNFDEYRIQFIRSVKDIAGSSSEIVLGLLGGCIGLLICFIAINALKSIFKLSMLDEGLVDSISFLIGATLTIFTYRGEIRHLEKMLKKEELRLSFYQGKILSLPSLSKIHDEIAALKASNAPAYMIEEAWQRERIRQAEQSALKSDLANEIYKSAHLNTPEKPLQVELQPVPQGNSNSSKETLPTELDKSRLADGRTQRAFPPPPEKQTNQSSDTWPPGSRAPRTLPPLPRGNEDDET